MAKPKKEVEALADTKEEVVEAAENPNATKEVIADKEDDKDPIEERLADLQKQIEESNKALQLEREAKKASDDRAAKLEKERQEAIQKSQQAETRANSTQKQAILDALKSAEDALSMRRNEYKVALNNGDSDAAVDASEKLAEATYLVSELKKGKIQYENWEKQQEELAKQPRQPQFSQTTQAWIDKNPRYLSDIEYQNDAIAAANSAVRLGIRPDTPEYFKYVDNKLNKIYGVVKAEEKDEKPEKVETDPVYAAPPSRSGTQPTQSGTDTSRKVYRLTKEQREAASIVGMSELDYAKELERMGKL